jgi:hypothetical protein
LKLQPHKSKLKVVYIENCGGGEIMKVYDF